VLIVDDNVTIARSCITSARLADAQWRRSEHGRRSLALLRSQAAAGDPYDLVLLDMNMPA
jgi:CheY-like chemotaxis protein